MKKFQVITDSTADVQKDFRDALEIEYLMNVFTLEGVNYDADLEWTNISAVDYYNKMRKGSRSITGLVKTSEVENKFTAALEAGLDILYIACSSKLSGSVNHANMIGQELLQKYPGRKIVCFDSLRSNYAEGLMAMDAAKMALDGVELDDCVAKLEETKLNYTVLATVGSLEWLRKAGRVKASSAFFGNLFGVKPIIIGDAEGNNYGFKKVKGRKNSLDELVTIVSERIIDPVNSTIYVEHADCLKDAEYVAEQLKEKVNPKNINISMLGPIIGATTGPDTITVNFYGKKVEIVSGE